MTRPAPRQSVVESQSLAHYAHPMCGIAGIRQFRDGVANSGALAGMMATIGHRGPDDSGIWYERGIGLGHTRLSIIDLAGSHQPMHSADERGARVQR